VETETVGHFVFLPISVENCEDMRKNMEVADKFYHWTLFDKFVEVRDQ
jgi:hypothetical protein